jgi:hypothetical protein
MHACRIASWGNSPRTSIMVSVPLMASPSTQIRLMAPPLCCETKRSSSPDWRDRAGTRPLGGTHLMASAVISRRRRALRLHLIQPTIRTTRTAPNTTVPTTRPDEVCAPVTSLNNARAKAMTRKAKTMLACTRRSTRTVASGSGIWPGLIPLTRGSYCPARRYQCAKPISRPRRGRKANGGLILQRHFVIMQVSGLERVSAAG